MQKCYFIPSENKTESFTVKCESKLADGNICYLATSDSTGAEVWLYKDAIEFVAKPHKIIYAYEAKSVSQTINLTPYQYMWGGEIRDKRSNSMCARPYFPRLG